MNFEKIELYGFKSFADKAEIKFGQGITGIVGPNGCGKSNVADAIRWVLGEQSAKSLRGNSMQDVIFSGTQQRKSLSYCEVSLFFDNSNHMFSLDYNEVIITRKLFRSGESEYYINKQPTRLKDIVALLHECGIARDGYSIIGQGKVEEIMSAKPEDRRLIFEEATGISKFKESKNESQRKLERTHDNILRYSDIITEIENQLAPLEKQAEKAREYNSITAELKHHELNTYIAKADGVVTAKEKVNTRIKGIDEQIDLRAQEVIDSGNEYNKIFADMQNADQKLKDLNEELADKRVGVEKSSGAQKLYAQKISFLEGQVERSKGEIDKNNEIIEKSQNTLQTNKNDCEEAKKKLNEFTESFDSESGRLLKLTEKIALGEELANANQKKVIESIKSLTDVEVNNGTMSVEKSNLLDKQKELDTKVDTLNTKKSGLLENKERFSEEVSAIENAIKDIETKILETEQKVSADNEKTAQIDNRLYTLNSTITSLITRDNFYKSIKDSYEGYTASVKLLMTKSKENAELKKRIKGVVAEIIKNEQKFDIALETALGNSAQNVITANPDDAKYLIEYLKQNKLGRVTFLPISSVKERVELAEIREAMHDKGALGIADKIVKFDDEFYSVISNLLGNTLIVDNIENATNIAKKYRFSFKIVTLDGDVLTPQGAMTGGSRRQDTVGLLSGDRKMEENAKLLAEKEKEMETLKLEKQTADKERNETVDVLNELNENLNIKKQEYVLAKEKLSTVETAIKEVGQDIDSSNDLVDEVSNRLKNIEDKMAEITTGGKKLKEENESAETLAEKHQQEQELLKKQKDELSAKVNNIQIEITELKAKIKAYSEDNDRMYIAISDAQESNKHLEESIKNAEITIEELKRDEEKVALSKEEQDYINGIRDTIEKTEQAKLGMKEKLDKNEEKRKLAQQELDVLNEKKNDEKIALAKIDSDLEYMAQSILEDYGETYETAIKSKEEGYDAKFGEQEINRLRKKRSSLGQINAQAIDDSKVLRERYEEMLTQCDDLSKAEDDLKVAIDKIKGEMLTQFDEGFKKINENFQRIFKELFGGGKAMLELDYTEVDDKLEAGIEIIAEPPGKKLQKLSLLSGGEKALTAIAILFSILKLRPMPFCVLDEIEAALDEANVDRFARYLKKFSEETQFIVITHRKPTMELADSLFGVTMEEKGISKTVSVKLSDAADYDVV